MIGIIGNKKLVEDEIPILVTRLFIRLFNSYKYLYKEKQNLQFFRKDSLD